MYCVRFFSSESRIQCNQFLQKQSYFQGKPHLHGHRTVLRRQVLIVLFLSDKSDRKLNRPKIMSPIGVEVASWMFAPNNNGGHVNVIRST